MIRSGARVEHPGWGTTVQDLGRTGVMRFGLTPGGAADSYAAQWANRLLQNPMSAATLEILPGGFTLRLLTDCQLALTGADLGATYNQQRLQPWTSWWAQAGAELRCGSAQSGLRAYLAVLGGWQTPLCFGSRSTVVREGLGGLDGSALILGDELPICDQTPQPQRHVAAHWQPNYDSALTLRYIPGYQQASFDPTVIAQFHQAQYRVSPQSNRMGVRLNGPSLALPERQPQSEGIALGTLQITGAGQPIVLLQDRQTVGGYFKLGSVCWYNCAQLAQRMPESRVQFQPVTREAVLKERLLWDQFFTGEAS